MHPTPAKSRIVLASAVLAGLAVVLLILATPRDRLDNQRPGVKADVTSAVDHPTAGPAQAAEPPAADTPIPDDTQDESDRLPLPQQPSHPAAEPALGDIELSAPRIEVYKSRRELRLLDGGRVVKTYRVALGTNPVTPKTQEGDRATPEGEYFISHRNPRSQFHLSLAVSYPGPADAERGLEAGQISDAEYHAILKTHADRTAPPWKTRLGGEIFLHGSGAGSDWTWGCIALDDADIEELYRLVPDRTPITIHP